jgi:hypothetical protein
MKDIIYEWGGSNVVSLTSATTTVKTVNSVLEPVHDFEMAHKRQDFNRTHTNSIRVIPNSEKNRRRIVR